MNLSKTILYNDQLNYSLKDYGILVPLFQSRAKTIHDSLVDKFGFEFIEDFLEGVISKEDLLRVHSEKFVNNLEKYAEVEVQNCFELISSDGSYNRFDPSSAIYSLAHLKDEILKSAYGTYLGGLKALDQNFSYYLGGGMHHGSYNKGRGFCLINDIVIAIKKLQSEGKVKNVLVIDVDAHKGDGTAELTEGDDSIFTFSIHMGDSWPMDSLDVNPEAKVPSNIDIEINSDQNSDYLVRLEQGLEEIFEKEKLFDLVYIVQGSDPYEKDSLPSAECLKLSETDMLKRDMLVFNALQRRGIPQAYTFGGGYGPHVFKIHLNFISEIIKKFHEGEPSF